jgi:alpha-beta hydrolase superfamily lysophospholipase
MIDIGGRRLRLVRAGERSDKPVVVLECGAFGCAADWAVVQERLARRGLYSLAYDRAGLGYSDPGPPTWKPCWPMRARPGHWSWSATPWAACCCGSSSGATASA